MMQRKEPLDTVDETEAEGCRPLGKLAQSHRFGTRPYLTGQVNLSWEAMTTEELGVWTDDRNNGRSLYKSVAISVRVL